MWVSEWVCVCTKIINYWNNISNHAPRIAIPRSDINSRGRERSSESLTATASRNWSWNGATDARGVNRTDRAKYKREVSPNVSPEGRGTDGEKAMRIECRRFDSLRRENARADRGSHARVSACAHTCVRACGTRWRMRAGYIGKHACKPYVRYTCVPRVRHVGDSLSLFLSLRSALLHPHVTSARARSPYGSNGNKYQWTLLSCLSRVNYPRPFLLFGLRKK